MKYLGKALFFSAIASFFAFGLAQLSMASGSGIVLCEDLYDCEYCPFDPPRCTVINGILYEIQMVHDCASDGPTVKTCYIPIDECP